MPMPSDHLDNDNFFPKHSNASLILLCRVRRTLELNGRPRSSAEPSPRLGQGSEQACSSSSSSVPCVTGLSRKRLEDDLISPLVMRKVPRRVDLNSPTSLLRTLSICPQGSRMMPRA